MLKLINKNYSQYHVLKESQTVCSVRYHQPGVNQGRKFDVTDAMFEFEFPEDLDTLKDKKGTR